MGSTVGALPVYFWITFICDAVFIKLGGSVWRYSTSCYIPRAVAASNSVFLPLV